MDAFLLQFLIFFTFTSGLTEFMAMTTKIRGDLTVNLTT